MIKSLKFKNIMLFSVALFFVACSSKNEVAEYNKPALYWYNKMVKQISEGSLSDADDTYVSLESEHRNSPLVSTALLVIVNAHIDEEEYSLANFYLDEYIKRFALSKNIDYARYLKIKANYLGFAYQFRDQELIEKTIQEIKVYKEKYPRTQYMPLVDTINTRLHMAKVELDREIAKLYAKKDKKKASDYYNEKIKQSWIDPKEIESAHVPFYRAIFE